MLFTKYSTERPPPSVWPGNRRSCSGVVRKTVGTESDHRPMCFPCNVYRFNK